MAENKMAEKKKGVYAYTAGPGRICLGPYLVWQRPEESLLTAFRRCFPWTDYSIYEVREIK